MKEFIAKHKIIIAAVAAAVIIAAVIGWRMSKSSSTVSEIAYVDTVENLTGQNASLGIVNRFSGVVEPQGLWTVSKNSDVDVKELFVSEGDNVEEGDVLFEYDISKYEEDLEQAQIDLERLQNEYNSTIETIAQLEKEKQDASSSDQANYTIQIKEQNLSLKDKELDIQIKEGEIEKLESNIENSEVKSGIDGVVKSINEEGKEGGDSSGAYITIMKVGTFRIKGTVNEQNIGELTTDAAVLVHSRVNDKIWKGTITKIDIENAMSTDSDNSFGSTGGDSGKSSKYPFYVELENSDGLIMGQHVYVELDLGQADENTTSGIWLASYMVDQTDPEHPFVWKDDNGKLKKQEVTIGEVREEINKVLITEGLALTDSICFPDETLKEGMKTAPMSEKPEETEQQEDADGEDLGEGDIGDSEIIEEGAEDGEFEEDLEEEDFEEEDLEEGSDSEAEEDQSAAEEDQSAAEKMREIISENGRVPEGQ